MGAPIFTTLPTPAFLRLSPTPWRPPSRKRHGPPRLAMVAGSQRACEMVQRAEDDRGVHEDLGSAAPPGKPTMPLDHTAYPGPLLGWPAIWAFTRGLVAAEGIDSIDDFPIRQEQRPVFLFFGQNGMFAPAGQTPGYNDVSKLTYQPLDGGASGRAGGSSYPPQVASAGRAISSDGEPDFDPHKLRECAQSFKDNILNMYPIIAPKVLDDMVSEFLGSTPLNTQSKANAGEKRKRPAFEGSPAATQSPSRPRYAVVLLVLALGKICIHSGKTPDMDPEADSLTRNSPSVGAAAVPLQDSPSEPCGLPSPIASEGVTPRSMHHSGNSEVTPGMEYFVLATDMIDDLVDGFGLWQVRGNILAGLYHGLLGRVQESYDHIYRASQILQVMMGPDIALELPLSPSGILRHVESMPYPNVALEQCLSDDIAFTYFAQVYLSKQRIGIYNLLYTGKEDERRHTIVKNTIKSIQNGLRDSMGQWAPHSFSQYLENPDASSANNPLAVRLHAEYWDLQVFLYRPFFRIIFERDTPSLSSSMYRSSPLPRDPEATRGFDAGSIKLSPELGSWIDEDASFAIHALVESVKAFLGICNQRFVIINVFGTTYAQWGNLLTLAACYKNEALSKYVDKTILENLFKDTIAIFRMILPSTSVFTAELNILIGVAKDLEFIDGEEWTTATHSSGTTP
ncbi:hypothetical protein DL771_009405 [Monosporascus sp. 5C6A]|nr:hypothetical protein DL771_009405 [Monosporascus sp. 5C6A]